MKSESFLLQSTCATSRLSANDPLELFRYLKSAIDLRYVILIELHPMHVYCAKKLKILRFIPPILKCGSIIKYLSFIAR
jgi:hypothetical protein